MSNVPLGHSRSDWLFSRPRPTWADATWNKQKQKMGICKVTDADCGNVDFVTSEADFLCLILHKSQEVVETVLVLVNTRTSPSNCAITNSCLLTRWCAMAPQADWNGPYMSSTAYSPLQRAAGRAGEQVGVQGMCAQPRCQVLFDFNMKAERRRGTGAMMPSAGPVPGPPQSPRSPSPQSTCYPRASGQVPQLLFSLPSN